MERKMKRKQRYQVVPLFILNTSMRLFFQFYVKNNLVTLCSSRKKQVPLAFFSSSEIQIFAFNLFFLTPIGLKLAQPELEHQIII